MQEWLKDNFVLGVASSIVAAIIIGLLTFFGRRILVILNRLWTQMKRRKRSGNAVQPLDLRFVELQAWFGVMHREDGQPNAQIVTHWSVTNASTSGMPADLVRARSEKPRLRDPRPGFGSAVGQIIVHNGDLIRPGATRRVSIHFFVVLPSNKLNKPINLKIVAVDQLSNEHKLPAIKLNPTLIATARSDSPGEQSAH